MRKCDINLAKTTNQRRPDSRAEAAFSNDNSRDHTSQRGMTGVSLCLTGSDWLPNWVPDVPSRQYLLWFFVFFGLHDELGYGVVWPERGEAKEAGDGREAHDGEGRGDADRDHVVIVRQECQDARDDVEKPEEAREPAAALVPNLEDEHTHTNKGYKSSRPNGRLSNISSKSACSGLQNAFV